MSYRKRQADELDISDFAVSPVWTFENSDEFGELAVVPVHPIPTDSLRGRIVGTEVTCADGRHLWAMIGNIDERDAEATSHFLTISLHYQGVWHRLARYHDLDYLRKGPEELASSLGSTVEQIFPISYNLEKLIEEPTSALQGTVLSQPRRRLSRAELTALAIRGLV